MELSAKYIVNRRLSEPFVNELRVEIPNTALELVDEDCTLLVCDSSEEFIGKMRGELGHKVRYDFNPVRAFWSYDYFSYQHLRRDTKAPGDSRRTWNRYKTRFMVAVARRAKII